MAIVIVLGAGAVGGFIGARLALAGHTVRMVGRPPAVAGVRGGGLRLALPDGTLHVVRAGVSAHASFGDAWGSGADLVILAVKSYDTAGTLADLRAAGAAAVPVLTLQNGVGNEETLAEGLGPDRVIAGILTNPISAPEPGRVVLERARGGVGLAAVGACAVEPWAQALTRAGLAARAYPDYRAMKWSKLLLNLLANAMPAILDVSAAEVMADPQLFAFEIAAWREALAVMRALRVPVVPMPGYPVQLLAWAIQVAPLSLLRRVVGPLAGGGRGRKPPSLQIDLARGRSEVGWLNGAVVRYGARCGIRTPVNQRVEEALTQIVTRPGVRPGPHWRERLLART